MFKQQPYTKQSIIYQSLNQSNKSTLFIQSVNHSTIRAIDLLMKYLTNQSWQSINRPITHDRLTISFCNHINAHTSCEFLQVFYPLPIQNVYQHRTDNVLKLPLSCSHISTQYSNTVLTMSKLGPMWWRQKSCYYLPLMWKTCYERWVEIHLFCSL